jgi:salicylate hydroxylase
MTRQLLIAGGGMGGLAAAIAARRSGWEARLYEQAARFGEAGAGLQLGPNATSILREWGLLGALEQVAAFPGALCVHDARSGRTLGRLALSDFPSRYGAPYATVHRADLHALLLNGARSAGAHLVLEAKAIDACEVEGGVRVSMADGTHGEGDALVGADGVWSRVRGHVWSDAPAQPTDHVAYRGVLRQADLPAHLRSHEVRAWLGPRLHAVAYPVRRGELLNVVTIVEGHSAGEAAGWDRPADAHALHVATRNACAGLRDLLNASASWWSWVLHDREPLHGPHEMARGRIALMGDAAHPLRPYLAQGAAMAIEDARELQRSLALVTDGLADTPTALHRYALNRWERCARVQRRSRRNGWIFHLDGPMRLARDLSMRIGGERVLDLPWLYGRAA